ncbi:hypothetical protein CZ794_03520 [Psychrobacter sp. JB385]|nr:hypothetical protein CZ794_03520 [Psychrobacter sp. JB385]
MKRAQPIEQANDRLPPIMAMVIVLNVGTYVSDLHSKPVWLRILIG